MENFICRIDVRRKGLTTAYLYAVDTSNMPVLSKPVPVKLNISFSPDYDYIRYKIEKHIGHDNFNLEII